MIYLIESAIWDEGYGEYTSILKIGFAEDSGWNTRWTAYNVHNPGCRLIHTIPDATILQEKALQYKFKEFKLSWYGREWFSCTPVIINYIKSVSLLDLEQLPMPPVTKQHLRNIARPLLVRILNVKRQLNPSAYFGDYVEDMLDYIEDSERITNEVELRQELLLREGEEVLNLAEKEKLNSYTDSDLTEKILTVFNPPRKMPIRTAINKLKDIYLEFNIKTSPTIGQLKTWVNFEEVMVDSVTKSGNAGKVKGIYIWSKK